jgi:hypothetical protein
MDMTENNPEERNEKPGATFDHKDPYAVRLGSTPPPEPESQPEPDMTEQKPAPEHTESTPSVDVVSDDPDPQPIIPIEMKEALGEYIDEDLAANVKALVDKVATLETELHKERSQAKVVKKTAEKADQFSDLWTSEAEKYGEVLATDNAKDRVADAMSVLRAGYKASGMNLPAETDLFQKAVTSEFGASMVEAREKEITDRVEARKGQFVSRGATTAARNERPEDRAARAVHRQMQEKGLI